MLPCSDLEGRSARSFCRTTNPQLMRTISLSPSALWRTTGAICPERSPTMVRRGRGLAKKWHLSSFVPENRLVDRYPQLPLALPFPRLQDKVTSREIVDAREA
jgi:hypothetical protein